MMYEGAKSSAELRDKLVSINLDLTKKLKEYESSSSL
jgi:hypothetical protein